jgi:hypothetical protein
MNRKPGNASTTASACFKAPRAQSEPVVSDEELEAYQRGLEDGLSSGDYQPPVGVGFLDPTVIAYNSGFHDGLNGPQL